MDSVIERLNRDIKASGWFAFQRHTNGQFHGSVVGAYVCNCIGHSRDSLSLGNGDKLFPNYVIGE